MLTGLVLVGSRQLPFLLSVFGYLFIGIGCFLLLAGSLQWSTAGTVQHLHRTLFRIGLFELLFLFPAVVFTVAPIWKHTNSTPTFLVLFLSIFFWGWVTFAFSRHPNGTGVAKLGLAVFVLAMVFSWPFMASAARELQYVLQTRLHTSEVVTERLLLAIYYAWNIEFVFTIVGGLTFLLSLRRLDVVTGCCRP